MGYFTATLTPGRFPLTDVLSLAVWIDGKDLATEIGNAMYERLLNKEFKGVKMVELNGCIQSFIWTKKPINKLEEIKGLKIRTPGGHQTNYIKSLGAEPVFMPLGDVYMAMETGTVDGIVTCPPLILAYKLHEVAKHCDHGTFGCVSEGVIMNQNSWKQDPGRPEAGGGRVCHNPFKTTGGLARKITRPDDEGDRKGNKVAFRTLPKSEANYWAERFQGVTRKWVTDLEAKGLPAKQAVVMFNEECEKRNVKVPAFPPELKRHKDQGGYTAYLLWRSYRYEKGYPRSWHITSVRVGMFMAIPLMLITTADVISRSFFNKPIPGVLEMSEYMLSVIILLGAAYTQQVKGHVWVDFFTVKFSRRTQIVFQVVTGVASLFIISIVVCHGFQRCDGREGGFRHAEDPPVAL